MKPPQAPSSSGQGHFHPQQAERLARVVQAGGGIRVGESTVASLCLHLLQPADPAQVAVLVDQDAGQVFYRRPRAGEILHLDVFHDEGRVRHQRVARSVYAALRRRLRRQGITGPELTARCRRRGDTIDLQTATGGGRLTGSLTFGQKKSLRQAHTSHVHVAMRLPADEWSLVFSLVDAVERTILAHGLDLRSPQRLRARAGGSGAMDMSPYTDRSDSLLLPQGERRHVGGARGDGQASAAPRCAGDSDALLSLVERVRQSGDAARLQQAIARLTEVEDRGELDEPTRSLAKDLVRDRWLERAGSRYRLTREGRQLLKVLKQRSRTVRSLATACGGSLIQGGRSHLPGRQRPYRGGWVAAGPERQSWQRIAVGPTLWAAMRRRLREQQAGDSHQAGPRIKPEDLRGLQRPRPAGCDICLLIDASASMAGERMEAARYLARYLTAAGGDRVAVVTFQERRVDLRVDFTRSPRRLASGLHDIEAFGLTPLAAGLARARTLLAARGGRALLLLITDGIPTVPYTTANPLADALTQAATLKQQRISFACIGLEPNRRYLQELAARAGGSLHVVRELEAERLIAIAREERRRQLGR